MNFTNFKMVAVVVTLLFSLTHSGVQAGTLMPTDIEARYELTDNSNDSSGNAYHGVDTDMTYVADGTRGTVASFNGTSSSINTATTGLAYSLGDNPNGQFSIGMWIKPTLIDGDGDSKTDTQIIMGGSSPGKGVMEIVGENSWGGMGASGGLGVNSGGGGGKSGKVDTVDLYDGDWHHVLIQWAGDPSADLEVWIDSNLATTSGNGYNGSSDATTALRLGGPAVWSNGGGPDKHYTGLMSDVMFFNRQILASEVEDVMSGTVIPEPSSMLLLVLGLMGSVFVVRRRK